jgi:integrase
MTSPKIKEIRPGVWGFRVSCGTDPVTGRRIQQRVTVVGVRADAVRRLREIEAETLARNHPSSAITLSQVRVLWDEWSMRQGRRRVTTSRMEASAYRRYLEPVLGDIPLHQLTSEVITRAYDRLAGTMAPSSIRRLHQQLSSILNWAVKRGYVQRAETVRVDAPARRSTVPTAPEPEQVTELLQSLSHDDDLWLAVRLASTLGLRRGELAGLSWADIDLEKGTIFVQRSIIVLPGGNPEPTPTKTGDSGQAVLSIDAGLVDELTRRRARFRSMALEIGTPLESLYVFGGADPRIPRRPDSFTRRLTTHLRRHPHLAHITLKALRSFVGTELASDGTDLVTAQTVLRHADHTTTARYYVAPRQKKVRLATVGLGDRLGPRIAMHSVTLS